MWTCGFVFTVTVYVSAALASELELFNQNGWMPVSSNIIYNQIRQGITQAPRFTKADNIQVLNTDILSFISQHQKYIDDGDKKDNFKEDFDQLSNEESTVYIKDTLSKKLDRQYDSPKKIPPSANEDVKTDPAIRRSKKLANVESNALINQVLLPKFDKSENKVSLNNDISINLEEKFDKENTYEVTEHIITEHEIQESKVNENGYEYNRPIKQNFTNDLIKHLSKYNINGDDNLENYALSRRPKAKIPVAHRSHTAFQFRVPVRYNSLNHLPVDPLLAVFLSNYGHYLQGQYGRSNNYNNLYGYLASNNIHNNRPFGLYKLFSDTDSSN